jgi:hypothetical protein
MRRTEGLAAAVVVAMACLAAPVAASADWQDVGYGVYSSLGSMTGRYIEPDTPQYDLKRIDGTLYVAYINGSSHHSITVRRLSADGSRWDFVGRAVNRDLSKDAQHPSLAAGPHGVPWIAWDEEDSQGVWQIRAAHYDAATGEWVEPDGRDWEINGLPPPGTDPRDYPLYSALTPHLVFLGQTPYITYENDGPVEYSISTVRLAADHHSWERLVGGPPESIPYGVDASIVGGLLHVGTTSGFDHAVAYRLSPQGAWEKLGGSEMNSSVIDTYGNPADAAFNRIGGLGTDAYGLWTAYYPSQAVYVSHVVNGSWQVAGGGALGPGGNGSSIRQIGGRLYVAWIDGSSPRVLHVSRLADDGNSWIDTGAVDSGVDGSAVLSSLDGVPYVVYLQTDGSVHNLRVARLDGAPASIGPDDGEGSGPGNDSNITVKPILPPREQPGPGPGPRPAKRGPCGAVREATAGPNILVGGPRGDCLFGGAGNDVLRGRGGEDRLYGDKGNDTLYGGSDEDKLYGGPGADVLVGGGGWDVFHGGSGKDTIRAADGRAESVYCGPGVDTVRADRADHLHACERVTIVRR